MGLSTAREPKATKIGVAMDELLNQKAKTQLREYFEGTRSSFDLPIEWSGTDFQQEVWKETMKVRAGNTSTYGEIAKRIGRPEAYRAVGQALNKNPWMIVVPCHRILNSKSELHGYALGLKAKAWLLEHEHLHFGRTERAELRASKKRRGRAAQAPA